MDTVHPSECGIYSTNTHNKYCFPSEELLIHHPYVFIPRLHTFLIIMMLINGQGTPKLLVSCLLGFSRRQNLSYVPSWLSAHVVQSSPVWRWLSLVSAALLIPAYHRCHHCIYATGNSNIVGRNPQIVCKGQKHHQGHLQSNSHLSLAVFW